MRTLRFRRAQGSHLGIPVAADVGAEIADRAVGVVGVAFKAGGRCVEAGLDCVGVVAAALAPQCCSFHIPGDYTLRGDYQTRILAFFDRDCFSTIADHRVQPGDILLCQTAPRQLHFAIFTPCGFVHAHAGLYRVVLTPLPLPWPVIGHWRYTGD